MEISYGQGYVKRVLIVPFEIIMCLSDKSKYKPTNAQNINTSAVVQAKARAPTGDATEACCFINGI